MAVEKITDIKLKRIQNEYIKKNPAFPPNLTCQEQNELFNSAVKEIKHFIVNHEELKKYLVAGIGFDETLADDINSISPNAQNISRTAKILRFFIDENGDIKVYKADEVNDIKSNLVAEITDIFNDTPHLKKSIRIINEIFNTAYVKQQIMSKYKHTTHRSMHQHVFCLLDPESKNLLNLNGYGNNFIGKDNLEMFDAESDGWTWNDTFDVLSGAADLFLD